MSPIMEPALARQALLMQHDAIRQRLARCSILAARFHEGEVVADLLADELGDLRRSIAVHNDTENVLIRVLLVHANQWGNQLIERMLVEHLSEHDAMWKLLTGPIQDVASRIPDLVEDLEAHMAAEERTFLSSEVMHSGTIERHKVARTT